MGWLIFAAIGIGLISWALARAGSRRPPTLRPLTPEQLDAFRRRMERS